MARFRLLALDLDGTILDARVQLDPQDVRAVERIKDGGITVTATTGRPFPGALPWVQRLGLDGPIICYQGAEIRLANGDTILDHGVPRDLAVEVIRFARERDLHIQVYRDDRLLVERDRPEAHEYGDHAGMPINLVPDLDAAMGPTTPKLVIVAKPALIEKILPEVRGIFAGRLNAATSMANYLEFTAANSDKAEALRFLCARLGVAREETAAAGDGRNDASMLGWAGLGVAVEGSEPEVIAAARNHTIPGPGHGGIDRLANMLLK